MSDEELDKLFKEAADGYEAPSDPSAWDAMAKRLDQASRTAAFWNWKSVSSLAVTGISVVAILWYISSGGVKEPVDAVEMLREEQSTSEKQNAGQTSIQRETQQKVSTTEQDEFSRVEQPGELDDTKAQSSALESSGGNRLKAQIKTTAEVSLAQSASNPEHLNKAYAPVNTGISQTHVVTTEILATSNYEPVSSTRTQPVADQRTTSDSLINSSAVEETVLPDTLRAVSDEKKQQESSNVPRERALHLKLAVSPDFSSIKFAESEGVGVNYGVMLGYSWNNRWSVYTGAIYSRKIYTSTNIEDSYTSGGYDYPVNELTGDCRVIDIPVNVYYTFFPERSISLKAGIGFSSYIMLKEDYTYHVDNPYGYDTYDQNVVRENNEWFHILNISVTVQKQISNRLAFEFEPFLKAPLAGVGEGEVSLVSLGAFLNLRYTIPLSKPLNHESR